MALDVLEVVMFIQRQPAQEEHVEQLWHKLVQELSANQVMFIHILLAVEEHAEVV